MLGVYDKISKDRRGKVKHHYGIVCFDTVYKGSRPKPSEEIEELKWFKPEDIRKVPISKTTEKALVDAGLYPLT